MKNLDHNMTHEVVALDDENLDKVSGGVITTIFAGIAAVESVIVIGRSIYQLATYKKRKKESVK